MFEDRLRMMDQQARAVELNILVWGPGDQSEHYEKRQKVRDCLREQFTHADVRFSEEIPPNALPVQNASIPEQELWHLAACDLCVVLDSSKGSGEEIAHFCDSRYCTRLMILTNEEYEGAPSFPAEIRMTQHQIFYADDEYESCNLVQRVVDRAKQIAVKKLAYE